MFQLRTLPGDLPLALLVQLPWRAAGGVMDNIQKRRGSYVFKFAK